jgi:hypothetical protein
MSREQYLIIEILERDLEHSLPLRALFIRDYIKLIKRIANKEK